MHSLRVWWRSWTSGTYLLQTWTVLVFLYGGRDCRAWFWMLSLVSATLHYTWVYLSISLRLYSERWLWANVFRSIRAVLEAFVMHLSWYMMSLGHPCRFWDLLHTSLMFAHIWRSFEYVRYSGIVRTMPTYTIWHLGIWSGSLFSGFYDFDFVLTFGYCGKRTTFALLLHLTEF